jgi:hypothetical protein
MTINRSDENWQLRNCALKNASGEAHINVFLNLLKYIGLTQGIKSNTLNTKAHKKNMDYLLRQKYF